MTPGHFKLWPDFMSKIKVEKMTDRPYLSDIKQIRATKGKYILEFKVSYNQDEPFRELDFLQKKILNNGFPNIESGKESLGIPASKKRDIINKLCVLMPASRKFFWENISEGNENNQGFKFALECKHLSCFLCRLWTTQLRKNFV